MVENPKRKYFKTKVKSSKVPKAVKNYVNKKLDKVIEDKFLAQSFALTTLTSTNPVSRAYYAMGQGTGSGTRVGLRVRAKAISLRTEIRLLSTAYAVCRVRELLVRIKGDVTGCVIPSTTEMFANSLEPTMSNLNPAKFMGGNFEIMMDRTHILQQNIKMVATSYVLKNNINKVICYNDNGSSFGTISKNGFFRIFYTDVLNTADLVIQSDEVLFYEDA